jgi:predicted kinase
MHSIQSCMSSLQAHAHVMADQVWQSSIDEFQCAECGAVYDVAITRLAARADYDAICDVCQKVMNEWHGTVGRAYTLKSQSALRSHH